MTDLEVKCPKCGKDVYKYFHQVDEFGMGTELESGTYKIKCCEGYLMEDTPYCGTVFKVKVGQTIEVITK